MLLTFEGIDGCGKTTQVQMLTEHLEAEGFDVLRVREPGGTELSEKVREHLLDTRLEIQPMAELLLFSAARAQLVRERIRPALETGTVVLCDRFYDSTVAYQGIGRQVADVEWLEAFNQRVTDGLRPDRTFWIDVPLEEAVRRRGEAVPDRMEAGGKAFMERVAEGYAELARRHPDRVRRLDGMRAPDVLHATIWSDCKSLLQSSAGTT